MFQVPIRIIFNRHMWPPVKIILKSRKAKRYFYTSDLLMDAILNNGDPQWRNWVTAILSLITAANTTDLALTGLSTTVGLPFALNIAFVAINIILALYHLKNFFLSLFILREETFKNICKLGLMLGICYGLAHAALITLAAFTPGVNLLLTIIFVANAVAIGINLAVACGNMLVPYLQRICRNIYYKIKKEHPSPIHLPHHVLKKMQQNANFKTPLNEVSIKEIKDYDLYEEDEDEDELSQRLRLTLATYYYREEIRLTERKPLASIFRANRIQNCSTNFDLVVKQNNLAKASAPLSQYFTRFTGLIEKLAYDLQRTVIIEETFKQYQEAPMHEKLQHAYLFLKRISYKNNHRLEVNIKIDGLKTALILLSSKKHPLRNTEDFVKILRKCIFFKTKSHNLDDLLNEIKTISLKLVEHRFLPKLIKLHHYCALSKNKIQSLLEKRITYIIEARIKNYESFRDLYLKKIKTEKEKKAFAKKIANSHDQLGDPDMTVEQILELKQKRADIMRTINPAQRVNQVTSLLSNFLEKCKDPCASERHLNECLPSLEKRELKKTSKNQTPRRYLGAKF